MTVGAARRTPARRRPAAGRTLRRYVSVAAFMSPWVIGFAVFIVYPMIASFYYSFMRYDILSPPEFVGLQNYRFMFTKDPQFWAAMRNTLWMISVGLPLQTAAAIGTAVLLTWPKRGSRVYRTLWFLPTMAPPVAAALAFVYVLNPEIGPVNQLLRGVGIDDPPLWFYSTFWSKWGLLAIALWGVGQAMIIYLAGLLDVPRQWYEAADIEGATGWQKFRFVTLPTISPVIFFSVVTGIIYGFQYFTQAYVASFATSGSATQSAAGNVGGPLDSTLFYSLYLYVKGFGHFQMGYASAMAWMLFLLTMVCTIVLIRTSRRWVHYAAGGFR